MTILNHHKALRSLRKTPVILAQILHDVTQARAVSATDGPHGWSVLDIVCHLHDFETIFYERVQLALLNDRPHFSPVDNEELIRKHDYAAQDLRHALAGYVQKRERFIALLAELSDTQWTRKCMHPETGEGTILDLAINVALHDVNHIEQIIQAFDSVSSS